VSSLVKIVDYNLRWALDSLHSERRSAESSAPQITHLWPLVRSGFSWALHLFLFLLGEHTSGVLALREADSRSDVVEHFVHKMLPCGVEGLNQIPLYGWWLQLQQLKVQQVGRILMSSEVAAAFPEVGSLSRRPFLSHSNIPLRLN